MAKTIEETNLPEEVKKAFAKKFPGVKIDDWEKEESYEISFEEGGREVEVLLNADGEIEEVEYEMEVEDLPEAVKKSAADHYPHCEMLAAERVEKGDGSIVYEVTLCFEVHMTSDGKIAAMGRDL